MRCIIIIYINPKYPIIINMDTGDLLKEKAFLNRILDNTTDYNLQRDIFVKLEKNDRLLREIQ